VANEAAAAAVRGECHEASMALLGSAACNAATIIVQGRRRTAAATREAAAAAAEAAAMDAAANADRGARDKAYCAADDAA
jgi:hypothetical protein